MRLFPLILTLVATALAQNGHFPKLLCNRLNGNYVTCCENNNVELGRPLEPGDKLTFNGTVKSSYYMNRINIRDPTGQKFLFHTRTAIKWDSPPRWDQLLYSAYLDGHWGPLEFSANPFFVNQPIQMSIVYTGSAYMVYSGNVLLKQFALRYSPTIPAVFFELGGDYTTNWIQMDCARPLTTTAPRVTKRHRHSSSSSSSASQEFCE